MGPWAGSVTGTVLGAGPLLPAATPRRWLDTHLAAHQAAHDEPEAPADHTWVGVDQLLADGAARLHRQHAEVQAEHGAPPAAAAKWLVGWFAGLLADAVGFTLATASAALLVQPGRARFRLDADDYPDRVDPGPATVAVAPGHPWAGQPGVAALSDDAALAAAAVAALTRAADPIVEACRGLARVGRNALWAEVADGFGLPVLHQVALPVDAAVAQRLQLAVRTPRRPWRKVPDLRVAQTATGWAYLGRKGGCCLSYQCPDEEPDPAGLTERERTYRERFPRALGEPNYCSTCSLQELNACEQRQAFWLEQERAQRRLTTTV